MEKKLHNASLIHKKIRKDLSGFVKDNTKLIDICSFIENKIKSYSDNEINNGIAFPVGLSINNIAAHWTPQKTDTSVVKDSDVLKIDFGVHNDGYIIDSAFTWTKNPVYSNLLNASQDAVYSIIKNIGIDTTISEIGSISEEIVNSYEIEKNGVLIPVKPINNICGHSIKQWDIHGGKYIQNVKNNDNTRIEENDILAIEVFTTDGSGKTYMGKEISHFMINSNIPEKFNPKLSLRTEELFDIVKTNFRTLAFTQKYLEKVSPIKYYQPCLDELYRKGILKKYPPLIEYDNKSKIAQFEHTIRVSSKGIINYTLGEDY